MKLLKQLTVSYTRRYSREMTRQERGELPIQTGALPWRLSSKKKIEVLLVTSRRSGRWTIPKGWPMRGKSLAEAAAREAFEEAGVTGPIDPDPIGKVNYVKNLLAIGELEISIFVYRMRVDEELRKWPELGQRKRRWFSAKGAAKRVDSPELSDLILKSLKRRVAERASQ